MAPRRTGAYAACLDEALAKSGPACKSFELEAIPSSVGNLPQRLSGSGSTELAEVDSTAKRYTRDAYAPLPRRGIVMRFSTDRLKPARGAPGALSWLDLSSL